MTRLFIRKALVISTALSLAFGGALIGVSAADAAPGGTAPFTVDNTDSSPSTYTVVYSGKAPIGHAVQLQDLNNAPLGDDIADADGNYIVSHTYDNTTSPRSFNLQVSDLSDIRVVPIALTAALPSIVVTSPTDGEMLPHGRVVVTGTMPAGSTIEVTVANETAQVSVISSATTFTAVIQEGGSQTDETIFVSGSMENGDPLNDVVVHVLFGTPEVASSLTVMSPANTTEVEPYLTSRRNATISGTATAGNLVEFSVDGDIYARAYVEADGSFSGTIYFESTVANAQTIVVDEVTPGTGTDSGEIVDTATVYVGLPTAPAVVVPEFTNPVAGSSSPNTAVDFTGTALPGTYVYVYVIPTAFYTLITSDNPTESQIAAGEAAIDLPVPDSASPVLVNAAGTWSITETLVPAEWTALAFDAANADGSPVTFDEPADNVAGSEPRQFVITSGTTLAATGADLEQTVLAGGLMLLAGAVLFFAGRRRRTSTAF